MKIVEMALGLSIVALAAVGVYGTKQSVEHAAETIHTIQLPPPD